MMRMSVLNMILWKTKIFTHPTVTAKAYLAWTELFGKIDRRIPTEEQAGVTSFEPDQEQNNLFLLKFMRHWMFSKSCGFSKTSNAFYSTQRLKLLGKKVINFPSLSSSWSI